MKKPICNGYTMIWVEVPDEAPRRRQRGTKASAMPTLSWLRGRLANLRPGVRLGGALAGALASLALIFTTHAFIEHSKP